MLASLRIPNPEPGPVHVLVVGVVAADLVGIHAKASQVLKLPQVVDLFPHKVGPRKAEEHDMSTSSIWSQKG